MDMSIDERLVKCLNNIGIFVENIEDFSLKDIIEDSLMFISMIIEIEQEFNIEIPDDFLAIDRITSLEELKKLVDCSIKEKS